MKMGLQRFNMMDRSLAPEAGIKIGYATLALFLPR